MLYDLLLSDGVLYAFAVVALLGAFAYGAFVGWLTGFRVPERLGLLVLATMTISLLAGFIGLHHWAATAIIFCTMALGFLLGAGLEHFLGPELGRKPKPPKPPNNVGEDDPFRLAQLRALPGGEVTMRPADNDRADHSYEPGDHTFGHFAPDDRIDILV